MQHNKFNKVIFLFQFNFLIREIKNLNLLFVDLPIFGKKVIRFLNKKPFILIFLH